MRIGYSFWGFLGAGVVDTPDGGRSHRRTLIDGLRQPGPDGTQGHNLVFLQQDRDRQEAGLDLRDIYLWDPGLPSVDALFLEWRWPIEGRNTTPCGTPGHTCDLHRQEELLVHYVHRTGTPTILWDKDRQLPPDHNLRRHPSVTVCEPALHPSPGAHSLLFPVADASLDAADPVALASRSRPVELIYVGNQYDRDEAFGRYFAPAAARLRNRVAGKWTNTHEWDSVSFTGRCAFDQVAEAYGSAVATVLLLPERYSRAGHMTQRIFEAVLAGCLPLTPTTIRDAHRFTPSELHVRDSTDVVECTRKLVALAGTIEHVDLIARCLLMLELFRASRQVAAVKEILSSRPVS